MPLLGYPGPGPMYRLNIPLIGPVIRLWKDKHPSCDKNIIDMENVFFFR
jgi:hypothetical protein